MFGGLIRFFDYLFIIPHDLQKAYGISCRRAALIQPVVENNIIINNFLFEMIIGIVILQQLCQLNIVVAAKHITPFWASV